MSIFRRSARNDNQPLLEGFFSTFRQDCAAASLEFFGTVSVASKPPSSTLDRVFYIATCMGLSLLVSSWLFYRVTGGLFNPNVSLALLLVGVIKPVRFVLYCIAQMVGAIAASALMLALTPGPLSVNTFLQQGINDAQGVFIEMFITTALVLTVLMLATEKHQATPFAPVGVGLTVFASLLFAGFYTGGCMNTARAFGPAVVTGFPFPSQWVYWVGPFLGSLLGASFYSLLKHYNYWTLNPDQATIYSRKSPGDPIVKVRSIVGSSSPQRDESNMSERGRVVDDNPV